MPEWVSTKQKNIVKAFVISLLIETNCVILKRKKKLKHYFGPNNGNVTRVMNHDTEGPHGHAPCITAHAESAAPQTILNNRLLKSSNFCHGMVNVGPSL